MPWWYKTWQHGGYNHTRVKQHLPRRHRRTWWSSWSRRGNQKSFTLTIPWNLASLARNYPGIIVRQHYTDQKQMGLPKEQGAEWKKRHLWCYCSPVSVTNGGRILWNVTAICETFKISSLMGRYHMKGGSECPLTGQYYRLEQWSYITLFLRKTIPDCISLEQKSCQVYFSVMHRTRVNLERRHYGRRHWCYRRTEVETSYSQSQMEQSKSLGENSVWEHPPWPRSVRKEEKKKKFFKENQMNYILQLHFKTTQRGDDEEAKSDFWTINRRIYSSSSRGTQSQTVRAERRIISSSVKVHRRHQNNIYITQRNVGKTDWRSLERGWRKRIVRCMDRIHKICSTKGKASWTIFKVRGKTYKETKNLSSWWCVARYVEIYVRCSKEESKTKMPYRKTKARQCQTINRKILCWTKRWRIQAHNESRSEKVGSSDASSNALQNTDKEQCRNPPQYWETQDKIRLYCWCRRKHENKDRRSWTQNLIQITSVQKGWIPCLTTVLRTSSFRCLKLKKFQMQRQQRRTSGKNWRKSQHGSWRKSEIRKKWSKKHGIRAENFILRHWWISVILRILSWNPSIKVQRQGRTPGWHWKRRSFPWTRIISISSDSRKSQHKIKASRMFRTSSWCSILLVLRSKWKMHQRYWKFQSQNVQIFGYVYRSTNGQNHGPVWKTQSFLSKGICTVTLWQDYHGKGNLRKFYWNTVGKKFLDWECLSVNRARGPFLSVYVDDIKLAGKTENIEPAWKNSHARRRFGRTNIISWPCFFTLHSKSMYD